LTSILSAARADKNRRLEDLRADHLIVAETPQRYVASSAFFQRCRPV